VTGNKAHDNHDYQFGRYSSVIAPEAAQGIEGDRGDRTALPG
jgi:hypothetical protein